MARYRRVRPKFKNKANRTKFSATSLLPQPAAPRLTFLDLPGEIRNKIYRLSLIVKPFIPVSKGQFIEPALLLVNQAIRAETIKIFYLENAWSHDCANWEHSLQATFFTHVRSRQGINDISHMKTFWHNSGSYKNKTNLLKYLKYIHEHRGERRLKYRPNAILSTAVPLGAFEISDNMKDCSWETIEKVLEDYFTQTARKNGGWVWE